MNAACQLLKQFGPLGGRILLSLIFILAGYSKIGGFANYVDVMGSKGLPLTEILLVLTILIELGGGLMILLGFQARWAALAIFLWLIPVTLVFHPFWDDPTQYNSFMKNLAIGGGMLYVMAFGSGPYSLSRNDRC